MWSSHTELSFHSFADVWFKTGTDPQRGIASPFAFAFVFLVSSQRRGTVMELNVEHEFRHLWVWIVRWVLSVFPFDVEIVSLTEKYWGDLWCWHVCCDLNCMMNKFVKFKHIRIEKILNISKLLLNIVVFDSKSWKFKFDTYQKSSLDEQNPRLINLYSFAIIVWWRN